MSASYQAVGWNRQKKIYDGLIYGFCLVYLLHIILSIGPLCRINKKFLPLLYNRRHLGVTMFCVALVHGGFAILQFHSQGNISQLVSLFTSKTRYGSLADFPFQAPGFFALLIFFLMAITSHDFWLHNLSPRVWKTLHMFVYLAYFLIIMHVMLGVIQYETNPVFVLILFVGAFTLIALHVYAGSREVKKDHIPFGL